MKRPISSALLEHGILLYGRINQTAPCHYRSVKLIWCSQTTFWL